MNAPRAHPQVDAPLEAFELTKAAAHVLSHNPLGILTTVNGKGVPRARWMVGVPSDAGLQAIYSLTGKHTRKLHDIRHNPNVCWIFSSPGVGDVVTITGEAKALPSLTDIETGWESLMEATHRFSFNALANTKETGFIAIRTQVHSIELVSPRLGIFTPRPVSFFRPASKA